MPSKVWYEITCPFHYPFHYLSIPKLQRFHRWSLGMDNYFHPTPSNGCNYLSKLWLNLIHVSKMSPSWSRSNLWHQFPLHHLWRFWMHCVSKLTRRQIWHVSSLVTPHTFDCMAHSITPTRVKDKQLRQIRQLRCQMMYHLSAYKKPLRLFGDIWKISCYIWDGKVTRYPFQWI